jgi:hypothetical protein
MMNRRTFVTSLMASFSLAPSLASAQRVATPESQQGLDNVVTFRVHEELWRGVELDHYRVVDVSAAMPDVTVVIGAMVNTGDKPVESRSASASWCATPPTSSLARACSSRITQSCHRAN